MADVTQGIPGLGDLATQLQHSAGGAASNGAGLGSLLGNMSMTTIMIGLVAGLVGSAYFMFGKRTSNMKMLLWGVALCVVPYFIANTVLLVVACIAMAAAPFVI